MNAVRPKCPNEAELASALANTARDVFRMMLDVDIVDSVTNSSRLLPKSGVLAVLGFTGPYNGGGLVWCSPEAACTLAGRLLMSEFEEPCDEVLDAIGEIANMIIGNVKSDLEPVVGPLSIGTPTVICGADFRARKGHTNAWTTVELQAGDCTVVAGITLCEAGEAAGNTPVTISPF